MNIFSEAILENLHRLDRQWLKRGHFRWENHVSTIHNYTSPTTTITVERETQKSKTKNKKQKNGQKEVYSA